jgi:hypothetical protein
MSEQQHERPDALVTADRLAEAMDGVKGTVAELIATVVAESEARDAENVQYGRQNRRMIWALLGGWGIDIVLTIAGSLLVLVILGLVHKLDHADAQLSHAAAQLRVNTMVLHRQVLSSCAQDHDLAGLPVGVNPQTGKASPLGVRIVSDNRGQWFRLGCPGSLPPPDPTFAHWARAFGIPVYPSPPPPYVPTAGQFGGWFRYHAGRE